MRRNTKLLTERKLTNIISNVMSKMLNEAESEGWIVDDNDAQNAYEFACKYFPKEEVDSQIVSSLSAEELASSLAWLFRQWDFKEYYDYNEEDED